MENSKVRKHEELFEVELDELIAGISKIKNTSKLFSKGDIDRDNKETVDHYKEQAKFREAKRQNYRPEAALWLSLASYISSSNVQDKKIRTLANLLGGHLARRRARPLSMYNEKLKDITISPRVRNIMVGLCEEGSRVEEVFGVWIKLATDLEKERIYSLAKCLQPAISVVEKNSENIVLVPRFPERMGVKIVESSLYGKTAKISEDGNLVFIFWMDVGIQLDKLVCGLAWTDSGVYPIFTN
ncbi:MAG: hypothetical protein EVA26_04220 [Burkholderiaceae bacterium]|nr:MAG: hypothetical protein EVA26_04220 [Burkholderiaceae bacterium]|tara:strand:+ start:337 stop:1062 length:726 start_codon:yes stop_codon:yes gene_type:complete